LKAFLDLALVSKATQSYEIKFGISSLQKVGLSTKIDYLCYVIMILMSHIV